MSTHLALALTAHAQGQSPIAWDGNGPVSLDQFLADVTRLAGLFLPGRHVLNVCQDRYHFMVGLAACLVTGRISLQPPTYTADMVAHLRRLAPDAWALHDTGGDAIDLPCLRCPEGHAAAQPAASVPAIDPTQLVAYVFTSGSTGEPVPHRKTWGALVRNARAEASRLGVLAHGHAIVGTVPPQHMYGFESTVLLSLHGACTCWHGRPFYPADIVAALSAVPRPRMLVTTPFHLRSLLDAGLDLPAVDLLLSATAPLSEKLALTAEERFQSPLLEIYGCTESGQLASRRTVATQEWELFQDVALEREGEQFSVSGGHVEGRVPLSDIVESTSANKFLLLGRSADMVNVAGKRTSLGHLNFHLNAIPGVDDGSFFLPDGNTADEVARLCAFAVAPGLTPRDIVDALRRRIDPIFLPRPLVLLDSLPREATGKLPRASLQALFDQHCGSDRNA
ncbi:MAG: AMP-binding protein [Rhodocyclaceae bacterium]